jgi:hypothetical protein
VTSDTTPAWPGTLPRYGPRRLTAIRALHNAVADDAWKTVAGMVADGWDVIDAFRTYHEWLGGVISEGIAQAVRGWKEGIPA